MILKNSSGNKKEVELIFKLEKNKKTYLVYADTVMSKIYGGLKKDDTLIPLKDNELEMLNIFLQRINRSE